MLPPAKVKEAERLLAIGGLSHRKIARAVGISRASIGTIAAGRRPDYEARREARGRELRPWGPIIRCAGCGAKVYSPCLACRANKVRDDEQEAVRAFRRRARELALRRLLMAVRCAAEDLQQARAAGDHLPAALRGASDCR